MNEIFKKGGYRYFIVATTSWGSIIWFRRRTTFVAGPSNEQHWTPATGWI